MTHIKEITAEAIEEIDTIKSTSEKFDAFCESLSVEELRKLYEMNNNGAICKLIIYHGKRKKEQLNDKE